MEYYFVIDFFLIYKGGYDVLVIFYQLVTFVNIGCRYYENIKSFLVAFFLTSYCNFWVTNLKISLSSFFHNAPKEV